jgi:hypothetical protein
MIILNIVGILANYTMYPGALCRFWKNLSGPMINFFWERFACNHSYGYAFRRIDQTDSLTDFFKNAPIVCIPMKYPG